MTDKLTKYYFDIKSPASFSSLEELYDFAHKQKKLKLSKKQIEDWLRHFEVYTTTR